MSTRLLNGDCLHTSIPSSVHVVHARLILCCMYSPDHSQIEQGTHGMQSGIRWFEMTNVMEDSLGKVREQTELLGTSHQLRLEFTIVSTNITRLY